MRWTATRRPNLTFDQKQKFWRSQTSQRSLGFKEKILGPLSFQISLPICVRRIRTDSVDLQMRWTATKRPNLTFDQKQKFWRSQTSQRSLGFKEKFWDLWVSRSCYAHPDWFCWPSNEVNCYKKDQIWLLIKNKNSGHGKSPKDHSVSREKFWDLWVSGSRCQFLCRGSGQENWEWSDK